MQGPPSAVCVPSPPSSLLGVVLEILVLAVAHALSTPLPPPLSGSKVDHNLLTLATLSTTIFPIHLHGPPYATPRPTGVPSHTPPSLGPPLGARGKYAISLFPNFPARSLCRYAIASTWSNFTVSRLNRGSLTRHVTSTTHKDPLASHMIITMIPIMRPNSVS